MKDVAESREPTCDWIDVALELPLRFAQVREDPDLDLDLLRTCGERPRVIQVASGGCTAPVLAAGGASHIHLVDVNPAQLALARLKLHLLETCSPRQRREVLGHDTMEPGARRATLGARLGEIDLHVGVLGPIDRVASVGPDHAGRYEWLFRTLRAHLAPWSREVDDLLAANDLDAQRSLLARSEDLLDALDRAWDHVMDLDKLVRVFGPDATQNRRQEFARHFSERTRAALDVFLLRENPFLCEVLVGRRRPFRSAPWLELPRQTVVTDLCESVGDMTEVLTTTDVGGADLVHLSNILDWLHPDAACATLEAASRALRPGGAVIIRQLNSRLDVRSFDAFDWDAERSRRYLATDRSYFYRDIHVGRKR